MYRNVFKNTSYKPSFTRRYLDKYKKYPNNKLINSCNFNNRKTLKTRIFRILDQKSKKSVNTKDDNILIDRNLIQNSKYMSASKSNRRIEYSSLDVLSDNVLVQNFD